MNLLFEINKKCEVMKKEYFYDSDIFSKYMNNAFKELLITNCITQMADNKDEVLPKDFAMYANMLLKKGSKVEPL